jgi:murein DD-endopeptidase MepM/ murein hydrolase activator NlpD
MIIRINILFFAILLVILYACQPSVKSDPEEISLITDSSSVANADTATPVFMYGIRSDSFDLIHGKIKRNGFLSEILIQHGVTMQEIDQAVRNFKSVFDVRSIRAGNKYVLFCERDSNARARYLVYEHEPTICYVFGFNDSIYITPYRKEIKSEIKYASGTIETSLWEAIMADSLHPKLAVDLSVIYAWTVDFFGLQKGDGFKVIYEELFVDEKSLGTGKIYGAQFSWSGAVITAIPFIQEGRESFFDIDGNSLRKAFLKAPLQFSRISSRFSSSRLHPILRIRRPHYGVDYAAPVGTPVLAIGDGRIISAKRENGSGLMVRIQHNSVYSTAYLHLSRFGNGIATGNFVKQGDIIGYVGSSGLSTGPHLDFRFYMNGSPVDPLKVEAPPVEPVSEQNLARFEINKDVVLSLLGTFN